MLLLTIRRVTAVTDWNVENDWSLAYPALMETSAVYITPAPKDQGTLQKRRRKNVRVRKPVHLL